MLNDAIKRIERMERRQKTDAGSAAAAATDANLAWFNASGDSASWGEFDASGFHVDGGSGLIVCDVEGLYFLTAHADVTFDPTGHWAFLILAYGGTGGAGISLPPNGTYCPIAVASDGTHDDARGAISTVAHLAPLVAVDAGLTTSGDGPLSRGLSFFGRQITTTGRYSGVTP